MVKLLILGATGGVGRSLLAQALDAGHEVTALVRRPETLGVTHPRLTVVAGDATDREVLRRVLSGRDAVLSSLGVGNSLKGGVVSRATDALISAMTTSEVRHVIVVSAFGVGDTFHEASLVQKVLFRTFLRSIYADKAMADEMLRKSRLDWTLVYPMRLTNGPRTGSSVASDHVVMKGMPQISRADVAEFMLSQLTSPEWVRRTAILTPGR